MSTEPQQWAFANHPDSEHWNGPHATKDEAILEALAYWGDPDDGFKPCVSPCRPVQEEDRVEGWANDWTFIVDGPVEVLLESLIYD